MVPTLIVRKNEWLVQKAKDNNLDVMTYGLDNDDARYIVRQHELGVHAAIVDDIAACLPALLKLT